MGAHILAMVHHPICTFAALSQICLFLTIFCSISGIEWSTTYGYNSGRPCVMSISIGMESSRSVNEAANMVCCLRILRSAGTDK